MNNRCLAITIDVGTTNTKVSLYEIATGNLVDRKIFTTAKKYDKYGELFDFEKIWDCIFNELVGFIKKYPNAIDSISVASVGEAGVLIDQNGTIMTPLITWYDKRSKDYIDCLTNEEIRLIYQITGLPVHTNYSISKIKWLVDYMLDSSEQTYTWLNIPDLICYLLTGKICTEYSLASRTMAYDITKKCWSQRILDIFKLKEIVNFPKICQAGEIIGYTDDLDNNDLKSEHISVRIAGHDHMVGAYGIDLKENELLNSTGTTEGLLCISQTNFLSRINVSSALSNGVFVNNDYFSLFSSMPTGGSAFKWFNTLFKIDSLEMAELCRILMQKCKTDDRFYKDSPFTIPHLNGSGAPKKDVNAKGLIYGLDIGTTREDLLKGIVLGLSLELKYIYAHFGAENTTSIKVIGPAIKNPLWLQVKADVLNKDIIALNIDESVSFGALRLSYPYLKMNIKSKTYSPNQENQKYILQIYQDYVSLIEEKNRLSL